MTGEPIITIVGNLTGDPDLRFTPSGAAVSNFRVASTPRTFNRNTQEWDDGTTLFLACHAWRDLAENVAETLQRGMRVVVTGRLTQREYEKDGQRQVTFDLEVDEVGPSLRYATARVQKHTRNGGQGAPQGGGGGQSDPWTNGSGGGGQSGSQQPQGGGDPWATR